jgi:type IV secretion system protein TrbL
VIAFFVLAVQLFVTLIEFKLTTLVGFILAPFGLFGRTAFLAERVLGHVMASGVKVLVLAVIVGIGSGLFGEFIQEFGPLGPNLEEALSLALAALCLLGLGVFGPGIANGLISGGPQLGAGSAVTTGLAAGGLAAAGAIAGRAAVGAVSGGARAAFSTVRRSGTGHGGATGASGGAAPTQASPPSGAPTPTEPPAWARRLRGHASAVQTAGIAAHALRAGDAPGGGASISLAEDRE